MDHEHTTVQLRARELEPTHADAQSAAEGFARLLRSELATRLRVAGVALLVGVSLAVPAVVLGGSLGVWHWVLLGGMFLVGVAATALPTSIRAAGAEPIAVLMGITGVTGALLLAGPGAFASAVAVSLLLSLLLPTTTLVRLGTLLAHGVLILVLGPRSIWELPLLAGALGLAFWFGHLQIAHWRTLWADREKLATLTERLEQESARQERMLTRRESELLAQQERMVNQEKWATLGRVATGVAHEIKNPLQAAMADLESARSTGNLTILNDVEVSLRRIETIARDVSRLRGNATYEALAYDLRPLLRASLRAARMGLRSMKLSEGPLPPVVVSCNQDLLVEVLANLLTNAWHAVDRRGSGHVRVHATLTAHRVLIYVDDDGPGIPAGAEERIFEAFITTKAAGKGTGLGLPISRSKLQLIGGDLWAEQGSSLGGARMVLALPYAPSDARRAPVASPSAAPARRHQPALANTPEAQVRRTASEVTSHGTLLLIDDDASVRRALSRTLSRHWRVLLASGSREARALARRESIDVVLCDMHLLQEDAVDVLQTLERVERNFPDRTVFMTGEPTSSRLLALAEANPDRMISKPFRLEPALRKLVAAKAGQLPPLERMEDMPTPPSMGALEPVWGFDPPTEELTHDD